MGGGWRKVEEIIMSSGVTARSGWGSCFNTTAHNPVAGVGRWRAERSHSQASVGEERAVAAEWKVVGMIIRETIYVGHSWTRVIASSC